MKRRNVQSYKRDIETLGRLRTAILMDSELEHSEVKNAIRALDELISNLIVLSASKPALKSA